MATVAATRRHYRSLIWLGRMPCAGGAPAMFSLCLCLLNVCQMSAQYLLNVRTMSTKCLPNVCPLSACCLPNVCPLSAHCLPNVCSLSVRLYEWTGHEVLPFFAAITMEYRDMKDFKKVLHFGQEALAVKVGVILESIFNLIPPLKKRMKSLPTTFHFLNVWNMRSVCLHKIYVNLQLIYNFSKMWSIYKSQTKIK